MKKKYDINNIRAYHPTSASKNLARQPAAGGPPSKQEGEDRRRRWGELSFRAREVCKRVVRRVGGEVKLLAELMKSAKNMLPDIKDSRSSWGIGAGQARHLLRPPHPVREQGLRGQRQQVSHLASSLRQSFSLPHVLIHARRCCL